MSIEVWTWIGIVTVIVWGVIIYDIANSPVYPVDYNNDDEEAELREVPQYEKSPPKSQTYSGTDIDDKYKHWKYPTTNCQCQLDKDLNLQDHTADCIRMIEHESQKGNN